MKKILYALLLLPAVGLAQNVPANVAATWTNPTTATDGTALTGPLAITKIQLFASTSTIADSSTMQPSLEVTSGNSGTVTLTVPNGATVFLRAKACNIGGCSAFSNQASKVVSVPVPGAPTSTNFTITIVVP